jgi:hypothetical protein
MKQLHSHQWLPGELDAMQLSTATDGTGDQPCEGCGRWITDHEPEIRYCSPSARRYTGKRRPVGVDLLLVIAEERLRFKAARWAYPKTTALHLSTYGWVLRLQPNPSALLRGHDRFAPLRLTAAQLAEGDLTEIRR